MSTTIYSKIPCDLCGILCLPHRLYYHKWKTHSVSIRKFDAATRASMRLAKLGRSLPEGHKQKISTSQRSYHTDNPGKLHKWISPNAGGESAGEKYFRSCFENAGLKFTQELPIGYYRLDFAFTDTKVDVEVDGSQHYRDQKRISSDKRKTTHLINLGWTVIRINWSEFQKLPIGPKREEFVQQLIKQILKI